MNHLRLVVASLSAGAMLLSLGSCSNDNNPFDATLTTSTKDVAKIKLKLDVASTRAEDPFSTDAERAISKVTVFVFDENGELETMQSDIAVSEESPAIMEVAPGVKSVYVLAANTVTGAFLTEGSKATDLENNTFPSTLSDLNTSDGFVMFGKSGQQQVLKSANENEMPTSNVFYIEMVRMLAKTQVKCGEVDASSFGFTMGRPSYRICQTSDMMRLVHNGDDVNVTANGYVDSNGNGTFDGYTFGLPSEYIEAVEGDFTAEGCLYSPENIVKDPVAGNTTFISLRVPFTPMKHYVYDEDLDQAVVSDVTPSAGETFYVVGMVDVNFGFEDFAMDPETKHVITFKTQEEADRYRDALNGGEASAFTVSETDSPIKAAAAASTDVNIREFKTVEFTDGASYYRINISGADKKLKVERNKFYKIAINSVRNLGFHSEEMLRPQDGTSDPGNSTTGWIETILSVAPWDEVEQPTDL